ncbi:site-specific integrase [Paracoccus aminovorans]|uniref:hypothetical protein n=1 Tax=Paracoccus aminovorans TaxID=34004 RepID=UPI002B258D8C|nr:hypothetical protein [Paracoccus aminovorans]
MHLTSGHLWVQRLKRGLDQPAAGWWWASALRRQSASRQDALPWLFLSERGEPLLRQAVNTLLSCIAARAGLGVVQLHTLRHPAGTPWPMPGATCG